MLEDLPDSKSLPMQGTRQMAWQDHLPLLLSFCVSKLDQRVTTSCGALQRQQAFIPFETTDSSNHAFDYNSSLGSEAGIISGVKWFSEQSTPELWNKTNQENHHFDFDQSAKAEHWIRLICRHKTPGANYDFGVNHIIRRVTKVTCWYAMLIAFRMLASELAILLWKWVVLCVERLRGSESWHSPQKWKENIGQMMHWQHSTVAPLTTMLILITKGSRFFGSSVTYVHQWHEHQIPGSIPNIFVISLL